eukprot:CAMPEP_0177578334 /NCGR_PEP_ID=MMETSP0419_2-20121207/288_1 /TAXON_ID=582737 /ORGANISM="Tetraselmis sp., Strain GSL018" /LENGTH=141 /DNA_ID=CAMNT_0019066761 /DNA_START=121 /DNA_END=543 /DNA_ORIENTATION=-
MSGQPSVSGQTPAQSSVAGATEPYFPESFKKLQGIEQKIVEAVELSGQTMEELSRMGKADREKLTQLCKQFLENVRDVKRSIRDAVLDSPAELVNRSSDYASKFAAETAASKVSVALMHVEAMEAALSQAKAAGAADAAEP